MEKENLDRIADRIIDILANEQVTIYDAATVLRKVTNVIESPAQDIYKQAFNKIVSR